MTNKRSPTTTRKFFVFFMVTEGVLTRMLLELVFSWTKLRQAVVRPFLSSWQFSIWEVEKLRLLSVLSIGNTF